MTPFVQELLKEEDWKRPKLAGIFVRLATARVFDMTQVTDLALDLERAWIKSGADDERIFLPVSPCFIEAKVSGNDVTEKLKIGVLLWEEDNKIYWHPASKNNGGKSFASMGIFHGQLDYSQEGIAREMRWRSFEGWLSERPPIAALLAILNTPGIFGRREHKPTFTDARKMAPTIGKRQAETKWTEIVLEIAVPSTTDRENTPSMRLSGAKARHYCRKHGRIVRGRVVLVRGHWRGDAAVGTRIGRYTVKPAPEPEGK